MPTLLKIFRHDLTVSKSLFPREKIRLLCKLLKKCTDYIFFSYTSEKAQSVKLKVSQKRPYKKVTRKTEWLLYRLTLLCKYTAQTRSQICPESHTFDHLFFLAMRRIFGQLAPFTSFSFLHLQLHFHSSLFCFGHSQQTFPLHPPPAPGPHTRRYML